MLWCVPYSNFLVLFLYVAALGSLQSCGCVGSQVLGNIIFFPSHCGVLNYSLGQLVQVPINHSHLSNLSILQFSLNPKPIAPTLHL